MSDYANKAIDVLDGALEGYEWQRDTEGIAGAILDAARAIVFAILSLRDK